MIKINGEEHWAEGHARILLRDGGVLDSRLFVDPNKENKELCLYSFEIIYSNEKSFYRTEATRFLRCSCGKDQKVSELKVKDVQGNWIGFDLVEK